MTKKVFFVAFIIAFLYRFSGKESSCFLCQTRLYFTKFSLLLCFFMFVSVISAQDMTPPVITSPARDTSLPCSNRPVVISTLSAWYNAAGFAADTDDSGSYTFEANLLLHEVISIFLNSIATLCVNSKSVVV